MMRRWKSGIVLSLFIFFSSNVFSGGKDGLKFRISRCTEQLIHETWQVSGIPIRLRMEARLPKYVQVGPAIVKRVYWYSPDPKDGPRVLFAYFPMPGAYGGKLIDITKLSIHDPLPERFIIGDGSRKRSLIGVDRTPGSPLWVRLQRIRTQILKKLANQPYPSGIVGLLRNHVDYNIMPFPHDDGSGVAQLPWDKRIGNVRPSQFNVEGLADDHKIVSIGAYQQVVPLEYYLDRVEGYCGEETLVNVLIARLFGIPSRIVAGALASGKIKNFKTTPGHFWTELEASEILDSTQTFVETPVAFGVSGLNKPENYPPFLASNNWRGIPSLIAAEQVQPGEEHNSPDIIYPWRTEYNRYFILSFDRD